MGTRPKRRKQVAVVVGIGVLTIGLGVGLLGSGSPDLVSRPDAPPRALLITDVAVVDVVEGTSIPHMDVLVRDGRIAEITPHTAGSTPGDQVQRLSAEGLSLIPGLIDAHCHVRSTANVPWDPGLADTDENLQRLLYAGVTRVFDPGAAAPDVFELREAVRSGERLGPTIHTAGPLFTAVDGHPAPMLRENLPDFIAELVMDSFMRQISTEEQARREVAQLAPSHPDAIKVVLDRLPPGTPRLTPELVAAIVDEAAAHDLRAVAHIGDTRDALESGEAGVAAWLHGVYKERIPDEDVARLAEFGIPMIPTMVVFRAYGEMGRGEYPSIPLEDEVAPPELLKPRAWTQDPDTVSEDILALVELMRTQRENAIDNVRRLHAAGVTILAGSDAQGGVIHGPSLHRELALIARAGLPPVEVLRSATLYPARFLAQRDDPPYGRVAVGTQADLVLVRGDPLVDPAAISELEAVILQGVLLDRTPLAGAPSPSPRGAQP